MPETAPVAAAGLRSVGPVGRNVSANGEELPRGGTDAGVAPYPVATPAERPGVFSGPSVSAGVPKGLATKAGGRPRKKRKTPCQTRGYDKSGGEAGIRTRGGDEYPLYRLATCRLQPLSHLSALWHTHASLPSPPLSRLSICRRGDFVNSNPGITSPNVDHRSRGRRTMFR